MKNSEQKKTNEALAKKSSPRGKDTTQFTDKERKAKEVADKQTRGGFD